MPQLYMIGGPNGAGKTTVATRLFSTSFFPDFVNADTIAAGFSRFAPETMAMKAGRMMLEQLDIFAKEKKDFAFEATMASRSFVQFLKQCRQLGYQINLVFLWLKTPEQAIERVHQRVLRGGHNIPKDVILRRYPRSIHNFLNLYSPLADAWSLCDNSNHIENENFKMPVKIAEKKNGALVVFNEKLWNQFRGKNDK